MDSTMGSDSNDVIYICDELSDFSTISAAFFILVFILSITGNSFLLYVLVFYESLKNSTNLFVLNLACSDLMFTLTLPFWTTYLLHHWIFGDFCCKFMIAAYFVGLYSSIILLTAMTMDRFMTVVLHNWPTNCVQRQKFAVVACVVAWVISIGASLGDALDVRAETQWNNLSTCEPLTSDDNVGYYLQVSLLFFLPLIIIVFSYSAILKTVFKSSNRKRYRTVVVVFCIVVAFFICWGPYNIMLFIQALYEPRSCKEQEHFNIIHNICQILAYSHCCMNPLLYLLSQKLQKHILHILPCMKEWRTNKVRDTIFQNETTTVHNSAVTLEMYTK